MNGVGPDEKHGRLPPLGNDSEDDGLTRASTADPDKAIVDVKNGDVKGKDGKKEGKDEKKEEEMQQVGLLEVFKFADCADVILIILGILCAVGHGTALPAMIIVFGDMIDLFVDSGIYETFLNSITNYLSSASLTVAMGIENPRMIYDRKSDIFSYYSTDYSLNITNNNTFLEPVDKAIQYDLLATMETFAIYYIIIACGVLVLGYGQVAFWALAAERQTHRIRLRFFQNIMRQEIGWFDTHEIGELNTRMTDDINKIHAGIGDKMGQFFQWFAGFLAGFIIGFIYGWKLTLVITAISPLLAVTGWIMNKAMSSMTDKELAAYAKAGAIAEEVLGAIRTVVAFGGQEKESQRYKKHLDEAKAFGIKKGLTNGWTVGLIWLIMFAAYGLGFWYGAKLTRDDPNDNTIGSVIIVFFSVLIGAFSIGNAAPHLQSLATARGAAFKIYALIAQVPDIDSSSEEGLKPPTITGNLEYRNVEFTYPARKEVKVLKGVSLSVERGQTMALVGSSGCGKSTMVQLMMRFYDPEAGSVHLDGKNLKDLNVKWLRQHIGLVGQEPVLFGTTIAENIRYGRENVTQNEIEQCAKMANAHDFIRNLPDGYETLVGERGAQLSGGQKQRVAIARALVRDPKILLLDEATSALDTESEAVVQEALDKARAGRTTLVIAHRLSTIKTADKIAGFKEGVITELGTHDELMKKGGVYATLVQMQTRDVDEEEEELIAEFTGKAIDRPKTGRQLSRQQSHTHDVIDTKESLSPKKSDTKEKKDKKGKKDKDKKEGDDDDEDEKPPDASMFRVLRMNAPEWYLILFGCLAAIVNGGVQPAFAVIFAEILGVFAETDLDKQKEEVNMYVIILVALGVGSFFTYFLQGYLFGISGENLTSRLRDLVFRAMLRQEIKFFDNKKNNTGALCTRLATDASQVQGASGIRLGVLVTNIANMGTAMVIAFIYGWKLTLVILAFVPIIGIGGALQMKMMAGVAGQNKEALEGAGKVAVESVENIRTVASLTKEDTMYRLYLSQLEIPYKSALKKLHGSALAFSFSQSVIFFAYAAAFYFGAYLIRENEMTFEDVFKVFSAIVFGAMAVGQASSFAPDAGKAATSAAHIFFLLDATPEIDSYSEEGEKPDHVSSAVKFQNVRFRYPTRPDVEVLQGLDVGVEPGETLALVGASGCGKSTTVQLMERFYDPEEGNVTLGAKNIKSMNVQWLRRQIGIVSQEPILFDASIAENIAYGDNFRDVSMDEIITAARNANIHNFISSLPNGYDTNVGDKGTQLSGGQKQRVAIARALVRSPKILLLDEATSALDTESEKIVQEALDKAREGRTCIVIAHRLSTIQNADKICVIKHGQVTEQGRHSDLMGKQGIYYRLVTTAQSRGK
ncbi:hypothetical protein FSP39_005774 [Pinctada imbricata]|uniref:Uncharacterized protein n=1 Tax=Pinctada imbricata TaxID=66713 RepID=A0AA88YN43_PINIB|nr:hypothetical protein FSP39_005774 [Pinctada imbricata]